MKKFLSVILVILFTTLLIGCDDSNTKHDNNSVTDTIIVDKNYKAEATEQTATAEKLPEILSAEDKAVKVEILKYINTEVDFRHNKQEEIQGKNYNVLFSGMHELQGNKELVCYTNDLGDEFLYKADTGRLFLARIDSEVKEKTKEHIDINVAQKTAQNYISKICNIEELGLSLKEEVRTGYFFEYSKYISGYKTNATFEIIVGFNNVIVYIRDNTNALDGKQININDNWIEQKKQEIISMYDSENAMIESVSFSIENNETYLVINIAYGVNPDGTMGAYRTEHIIKISHNT